jgi:hypothetical protein
MDLFLLDHFLTKRNGKQETHDGRGCSRDGFYVVHTPHGEVRFHKDEQGLLFVDLDKSDKDVMILLVQLVEAQGEEKNNEEHTREGTALVQMVCGNYKGFTKREVSKLKKQDKLKRCMGIQVKRIFRRW